MTREEATSIVGAFIGCSDPVGEWVHTGTGRIVASVAFAGLLVGAAWWGVAFVTHGVAGVRKREWAPIGMSPEQMRSRNWPVRGTQALVVSVLAVGLGAFLLCGVPAFALMLWLLWGHT